MFPEFGLITGSFISHHQNCCEGLLTGLPVCVLVYLPSVYHRRDRINLLKPESHNFLLKALERVTISLTETASPLSLVFQLCGSFLFNSQVSSPTGLLLQTLCNGVQQRWTPAYSRMLQTRSCTKCLYRLISSWIIVLLFSLEYLFKFQQLRGAFLDYVQSNPIHSSILIPLSYSFFLSSVPHLLYTRLFTNFVLLFSCTQCWAVTTLASKFREGTDTQ